MSMYIKREEEKQHSHCFSHILADIPDGGTISIADLTQSVVEEGTPVGLSTSDGLYHVVKTATISTAASSDATTYSVEKGHNFKVGEFVMFKTSSKSYAITAIETNASNSDVDDITVATTIGAASVGDVIIQAEKSTATTSAFLYQPCGLVSYSVDASYNATIGIVTMGQVFSKKIKALGAVASALPLINVI